MVVASSAGAVAPLSSSLPMLAQTNQQQVKHYKQIIAKAHKASRARLLVRSNYLQP